MIISHNLSAIYTNRQLGIVDNKRAKRTEHLSSGYKINRAADDAAGLAISEKMRRQIRGLQQGAFNSQDGISMVQVADGAMNEIQDMLQRGNELSVRAANGTLSDDDRSYIQTELEEMIEEIDAISLNTTFNEIKVLNPTYVRSTGGLIIKGRLPSWVNAGPSLGAGYMVETYVTEETYEEYDTSGTKVTDIKVPIHHSATTIDFSSYQGTNAQKKDLYGSGFYFTCCTCSNHYSVQFTNEATNSFSRSGNNFIYNVGIQNINNADDLLAEIIKATGNGNPNTHYTLLEADPVKDQLIIYDDRYMYSSDIPIRSDPTYTSKWPSWQYYNYQASANKNNGDGLFGEGVAYDKNDSNARESADIILQVGSEAGDQLVVTLPYISSDILKLSSIDVRTQAGAWKALDAFKYANQYLSKERTRMGTYQNRLEHIIKNLDNVIENTTKAESAIRDTDMAKEMVEYSNQNILMQSAQAMLTQANQQSEGILKILQ